MLASKGLPVKTVPVVPMDTLASTATPVGKKWDFWASCLFFTAFVGIYGVELAITGLFQLSL